MKSPSSDKHLHDVQSDLDDRNIPIDQVGVTGLRLPITVLDRARGRQETVARCTLSVDLPHHFKGTHMSRFIEILNRHRGEVTMHTIPRLLSDLRHRLEAESAQVELEFPYFLQKAAPASGATALMDYSCFFKGEQRGSEDDFVLGVTVPVTSVCPCSKSISDYGAHNQRSTIQIRVRTRRDGKGVPEMLWIEELIEIAESSASAPVYPLLKRPDERHVTMQAFDNPAFVEDMVRAASEQLRRDERVIWFQLHVEAHESIHNHNAFARLEWRRLPTHARKQLRGSPTTTKKR